MKKTLKALSIGLALAVILAALTGCILISVGVIILYHKECLKITPPMIC